jgi:hypothetical protein
MSSDFKNEAVLANSPKHKRRFLQFGLRTLLVITLLFCCCVAAYKWYRDKVAAEERANKIEWMISRSDGTASIVEEGDVILVKKGTSYAGLIIKKQTGATERMEFDWAYRTDGSGKIFVNDPAVQRGSGIATIPTANDNIHFGPFDLHWSGGDLSLGLGWFYLAEDDAFEICILRKVDIQSIDASSSQHKYKARPEHLQLRKPSSINSQREKTK